MAEELNSSNFEEKTKGKKVIIDFWAPWCSPCRMMAPAFKELSEDLKGKLEFFKLNVDENKDVSLDYHVRGIPCLIILDDGKEVDRIVGFYPKESLKSKIEAIIK